MADSGLVFGDVAEEYDRVRPGYPEALIDAALELLRLRPGARVLEVGCGTGKLTRELAARGLSIDAVDPSDGMIRVARRHVEGAPIRFHAARFEDVDLAPGGYDAVFAATSWHWVDPAVGWARAAELLRPGGGIALLTHTVEPAPEILAAWRDVVPEAVGWSSRDSETLWAGAAERVGDVSALWSWLTKADVADPSAAARFGPADVRQLPIEREQSIGDVLAGVRTQSHYLRLDAERRALLENRLREAIGAVLHLHVEAALVVARVRS